MSNCLLYNAGGWHLSASLLSRIKAWENEKLRKMFWMRRAPLEGRSSYLLRTAAKIRSWFEMCGLRRTHEQLVLRVHSWASQVTSFRLPNGQRPLFDLMYARRLQHWDDTSQANALIDPFNKTHWRHARQGKTNNWEQPMVNVYGLAWWERLFHDPKLWYTTRKDFMIETLETYGLGKVPTPRAATRSTHTPSQARIDTPIWRPEDIVWDRQSRSFEFPVDNATLAGLMSGCAASTTTLSKSVNEMIDNLQRILRRHGWRLRHQTSSWVQWIPRERNCLADKWANHALDTGRSCIYSGPLWCSLGHDANYVVMSDGAYRSSCSKAAAAWTIIGFHKGLKHVIGAGAALLPECTDSMQAEMAGLQLGIEAFTNLISGSGICSLNLARVNTTMNLDKLPCNIRNMYVEAGVAP